MKLINRLRIIMMTSTISFGTSNAVYFKDSLIQKTMKHFMDTSNTPVVVNPKENKKTFKNDDKGLSL